MNRFFTIFISLLSFCIIQLSSRIHSNRNPFLLRNGIRANTKVCIAAISFACFYCMMIFMNRLKLTVSKSVRTCSHMSWTFIRICKFSSQKLHFTYGWPLKFYQILSTLTNLQKRCLPSLSQSWTNFCPKLKCNAKTSQVNLISVYIFYFDCRLWLLNIRVFNIIYRFIVVVAYPRN